MSDPYRRSDDDLAYGDDYGQSRGYGDQKENERGGLGDTFKKYKTKYDQYSHKPKQDYGYGSSTTAQSQYGQYDQQTGSHPPQTQPGYGSGQTTYSSGQPAYPGGPSQQPYAQKPDLATKLMGGLHGAVHSIGTDVAGLLGTQYPGQQHQQSQQYGQQQYQQYGTSGAQVTSSLPAAPGKNRFDSFAAPRENSNVKWYVDGCGYMWAVSMALENARESVWILDWWLSPELYLRRPPALNEEWRLDRVLQRAASRGVKINIIVYKEVTQALTLSSSHTKHALEALSPNIAVFRHPDHLPDAQTAHSSLISSLQGLKLDAAGASRLGADALKGIYGLSDDVILYWAHHEKLCMIDGQMAFMGGLDLCYGRWDMNQHCIADAHPSDLNKIVFPGQDFNNARVSDFDDVAHPFQNKLDRTKNSRMGWSDISICLQGPCVQDLRHHFTDRWNFIYDEKYNVRRDVRYSRLPPVAGHSTTEAGQYSQTQGSQQTLQPGQYPPPPGSQGYTPPPWQATSRPTTPGNTAYATVESHSAQPTSTQYTIGQYPTTLPPPPAGPPPQPAYTTQQTYGGYTQQGTENQPPSQPTNIGYNDYHQQTTSVPPAPYINAPQETQPYQQSHSPAPPPQNTYATEPYQQSHSPAPPQQSTYDGQSQQQSYSPAPPQPSTYDTQTTQYPNQTQYAPHTGTTELAAQGSPYNAYHPTQTSRGLEGNDGQYSPSYSGDRGFGGSDDQYATSYNEDRGFGGSRTNRYRDEGRKIGNELGNIGSMIQTKVGQKVPGNLLGSSHGRPSSRSGGSMRCQVLRSCTKWSNGTPTEQSIQNAYIDVIRTSQHFIYIENQFFITATGDKQGPVKNQIGKALVERIIRAARERTPYKVIVLMPAIPAFAGDFESDASLGTRAICEFQYNSICRGGHSIMEEVGKAGYNPMDYIRFYNLRNYDRINYTTSMDQAQRQSGVSYEDARRYQEDTLGSGYGGQNQTGQSSYSYSSNPAQQYQTAAYNAPNMAADRWDSVASCYMLGGEDIRNVPWSGPPDVEIDAFISEELYIHSKVMIADDQVVICGSANLNDRSMLGYHDSEIALLISDPTPQQSTMAGRPWQASRFAASLRRQLFRKHLGLLPAQDMRRPDVNFEPLQAPNAYDWGSPEDRIVSDPLSDTFQSLWNTRARTNTEVFRKAFRAIPDDYVRSWAEYKEFYEYYFSKAGNEAIGKDELAPVSRVEYGHVVRSDFPGGVKELKDLLSTVKGTLVEMPLCFLQNEDIAKEGIALNALTEELYT